jgi:hypothetical protein
MERHLALAEQADAAAVKGADVVSRPEPELEDVASFDEERAFLGEEERKAREVGAPRVDLRSPKSVLTVSDASVFARTRCVASRLRSASLSVAASGDERPVPAVTAGRTLSPSPS